MKKFFGSTLMIGLLVCGLVFVSCNNGTTEEVTDALFYTLWEGTNAYGTDYDVYFQDGSGYIYASYDGGSRTIHFTYTVSGTRITLRDLDGDLAASGTVSGNTMRLTDPAGDSITLTKTSSLI